jgi:hypothetical protein
MKMQPFIQEQFMSTLSKNLNCSLNSLNKLKNTIHQNYANKFTTSSIFGVKCFDGISKKIAISDADSYSLTERCIKRAYKIHNLTKQFPNDVNLKQNVAKADAFWKNISQDILPLEIFWSMEYNFENGNNFSADEWNCLNYFKYIANFYLEKTNAFYPYLIPYYSSTNVL